MKYEEYAEIAKDVTIDTALQTVQALLEKAKTDAVEHDAEIAKLTEEIESGKAKYNDLQVDYIRRFTTQSKAEEKDDEEDEAAKFEAKLDTEINEILGITQED